jgi:putative addiction module killer protein
LGVYGVFHCVSPDCVDVFDAWLDRLNDPRAVARIVARIDRMCLGNLGDSKPVGQGIWELRIDHGPGYRVYYVLTGRRVVPLLCGGDKRSQMRDIRRAVELWNDYRERESS